MEQKNSKKKKHTFSEGFEKWFNFHYGRKPINDVSSNCADFDLWLAFEAGRTYERIEQAKATIKSGDENAN